MSEVLFTGCCDPSRDRDRTVKELSGIWIGLTGLKKALEGSADENSAQGKHSRDGNGRFISKQKLDDYLSGKI